MNSNATAPRTPKAYTRRIKSASISWYNHCCYIFDFCLRAIKNVSNQSCPSSRDRQLAARNAPQDPGTRLCATPLPDQNQASLLSLWPQRLTDLSPLSPLTYVLKTLFHCYLFPDILPMPAVQRASGVISTTSHWSYHYQAAHKNQHGRLHFDQH